MASASSISSIISSAMGDLRLLKDLCPKLPGLDGEFAELVRMKGYLAIHRTFLLCARKWDDNEVFECFEWLFPELGQAIHSFYLTCLENGYSTHISGALPLDDFRLKCCILINGWKVLFSDCSSTWFSDYIVNKDELMELMDSVLEQLQDAFYMSSLNPKHDYEEEVYEALREMLIFLRNLIYFVTIDGLKDEQLGPLLSHAESVTVKVACISFDWICGKPISMDSISNLLLQEIIRLEPRVRENCVEALIASKLSTQSFGEANLDEHFLRDFVDSLLFYLWQILKTEACLMISLKDQLHTLWEGIISLRTILKGNPMFVEKMRYLIRFLLCDAWLVVFSLSFSAINDGLVKGMDLLSFKDFVEGLELIKATRQCPGTLSSNIPMTDVLGFLNFLLKYIMELTNSENGVSALAELVNCKVQTIQEELVSLRPFLERIVEMRHNDDEFQALWDSIGEVAYKAEFLIDSSHVENIPDSRSMLFDSMVEEIKVVKADALKIFDTRRLDLKFKEVTKKSGQVPSNGSMPMISNNVVGFDDEANSVINRLRRGSSQLQIIPIVGMPGLGKTTLAKKIYTDSTVTSHFYTRCWCNVSQVYHKKHLLCEIFACIFSKIPNNFYETCEEDLAAEVRKGLLRTRYLIVLDDVWDTGVWNDLEGIFPDNRNGSRVIITSRYHDIVASTSKINEGPHYLRSLTPDESWDLLNMMLYPGVEDFYSLTLSKLRLQILEICQGLPLTIVILAGILANEDPNCWEKVVESLSIISRTEQCISTLELSYQNLPDCLKSCFLYFGAFPEGHEHIIEDLICLWIAEGLVQETEVKSIEDVANDYMMTLISRSLVIVSKESLIGGVEACRVHDLLHEFCVKKGIAENFLLFVHEHDEPYTLCAPHHLRRLCINYSPKNFLKFRLFSPTISSLFISSNDENFQSIGLIVHLFKLVRVLYLRQVYLDDTFPEEIGLLVLLRYLAIQGDVHVIPSFVGNLLHLETFILQTYEDILVSLPDIIWNLKKLRHLEVKSMSEGYCSFSFPTENLENASKLCALHTLSGVVLHSVEEFDKILRQFPNIRKLKCLLWDDNELSLISSNTILAFDFLVRLESITLLMPNYACIQCEFEYQFPLTVRELTLSGFHFSWSKMSAIENLPNLEVLKIHSWAFDGNVWNVNEDGFPKVNFLELVRLDFVKLTASGCTDCFPSLRKLVLQHCLHLEEIPSCLGSSTLEVIEVCDSANVADSIKQVEEEQKEMGNTELKVIVHS